MLALPLLQFLPWVLTSLVMMGIALVGWRRTHATGALLIAVAACLQIVDTVLGALLLCWSYTRGTSYTTTASLNGLARAGGHMVSSVLFIVGVALLLRRLPTAQRRA